MNKRLSGHIIKLLLESECVVVPSLGAFLRLYEPSRKLGDFAGMSRYQHPGFSLGFNALIGHQDGLLASSYQKDLGISYQQAVELLEDDVDQLREELQREGRVLLDGLGYLSQDITGNIAFAAKDTQFFFPEFYGISNLEILTLKAIQERIRKEKAIETSRRLILERANRRGTPRAVMAAASLIGAVIIFMSLMLAGGRDLSMKVAQAWLFPEVLLEELRTNAESFTKTFDATGYHSHNKALKSNSLETASAKPVLKHFHIVVASCYSPQEAMSIATRLVGEGFPDAKVILLDGKIRVAATSLNSQKEADEMLQTVRTRLNRPDAWILRK